jgi:hypothetical protein
LTHPFALSLQTLEVHGFPELGQTIGVNVQSPVEGTHASVVQDNPSLHVTFGVLIHPKTGSHEMLWHKSVKSGTQLIEV